MNFNNVSLKKVSLKKTDNLILEEDLKAIENLIKTNLYLNLELCGAGCFGEVYKYNSLCGKTYAIKISKKEFGGADVYTAHDIETLLELQDCEYILKLYAYDNKNLGDYFVMVVDFVDGINLCKYSTSSDIKLHDRFVEIWEETLSFICSKQISINDLHGNNIMIDRNRGIPVIVDFGGLFKTGMYYSLNDANMYIRRIKDTYSVYQSYRKLSNIVA